MALSDGKDIRSAIPKMIGHYLQGFYQTGVVAFTLYIRQENEGPQGRSVIRHVVIQCRIMAIVFAENIPAPILILEFDDLGGNGIYHLPIHNNFIIHRTEPHLHLCSGGKTWGMDSITGYNVIKAKKS